MIFLIVISPREGILSAKSTDIERELSRGFSKLEMLRRKEEARTEQGDRKEGEAP